MKTTLKALVMREKDTMISVCVNAPKSKKNLKKF